MRSFLCLHFFPRPPRASPLTLLVHSPERKWNYTIAGCWERKLCSLRCSRVAEVIGWRKDPPPLFFIGNSISLFPIDTLLFGLQIGGSRLKLRSAFGIPCFYNLIRAPLFVVPAAHPAPRNTPTGVFPAGENNANLFLFPLLWQVPLTLEPFDPQSNFADASRPLSTLPTDGCGIG